MIVEKKPNLFKGDVLHSMKSQTKELVSQEKYCISWNHKSKNLFHENILFQFARKVSFYFSLPVLMLANYHANFVVPLFLDPYPQNHQIHERKLKLSF